MFQFRRNYKYYLKIITDTTSNKNHVRTKTSVLKVLKRLIIGSNLKRARFFFSWIEILK